MPTEPSLLYEALKDWILPNSGPSKAAVLFVFGFGCQMFSVLVLRWPLRRFQTLAIGAFVSIAVEIIDLQVGSPLRKSLFDVAKVNTIPLLLVLAARSGRMIVEEQVRPSD